ncbi:hypothetical protein HYALB_00006464 [Hymenoscyphus albidus]|uniref:Uncharacterized protein n=1 Tax=Hymenoscyphus albidus TaxID=595503 RepID=A0A9N9PSE0_9HELO|nr:hypothetical protein HYALB_00006464 [Hymenoscyphus albidus]
MSQPHSPPDPPVSESVNPRNYQREYSEDRYHALLAAVQHKYRIDDNPSGPRGLHKASFGAYTDRSLESTEAEVDPRDKQPAYIEHLHKTLRNNIRALDGRILYLKSHKSGLSSSTFTPMPKHQGEMIGIDVRNLANHAQTGHRSLCVYQFSFWMPVGGLSISPSNIA